MTSRNASVVKNNAGIHAQQQRELLRRPFGFSVACEYSLVI
jgi:hypothetical protein